eukprot:scaffold48573_cov30-Cyclotella_meneghiniana.AAC.2
MDLVGPLQEAEEEEEPWQYPSYYWHERVAVEELAVPLPKADKNANVGRKLGSHDMDQVSTPPGPCRGIPVSIF